MRTDLHAHSTHSLDADHTVDQMCTRALETGLEAFAITDHMEWLPDGGVHEPDFPRYFDDVTAARETFAPQGLHVLSGVELGNPHEHMAAAEALLAAYDFEVVIGSIHWLGQRNIHVTKVFAGSDPYAVYELYFDSMADMAARAEVQIIAHFDRIFQPGMQLHGAPKIERVERSVRGALEAMVEHGRLLELNTRFVGREPGWRDTFETVLGWYRQSGGRQVSVSSDAHRMPEIGRHFDTAYALVEAAGLTVASAPQPSVA